MKTNQTIAVVAVFALVGGALMLGRVGPAEAHDAKDHADCACAGQRIELPQTDDEGVARMYATAVIVSAYIRAEEGNATVDELKRLTKEVAAGLR